jgi:O-acetylserine/cysteine efflux transporter
MLEGTHTITTAIMNVSWLSIFAILYNAYPTTLFGFGVWNWLLGRYPAALIAPFTLLVPVFGMMCAVFFLGEPLQQWKVLTAVFIVVGLCINIFGSKWLAKRNTHADKRLGIDSGVERR